uniref:LAGLIDADG endonuclease n=3 Tax=Ceratocystis TaxID=5157 RepID=A0A5C1VB36_9PEZI|nr:LAGLIDADG endonuclease [Ceratocystis cacaofunesta]YP_009704226.1 LAGLIDADG endonuclease [Ceratocystis fimbriata]YP_009710378.1 LAGLIDADG endonuclease [Ceratocystis albifundus]AFO38133.1 LAGLIDADG endonuclease [Ceratocystis cacaofunesta]QEN73789.1 LAGLIDADG endonuclease [Ceratocystis fimbriata]QFX74880.1 LAGLIDADG endonuclease [Ceratocystis albifundus]
MSKYNSYYNLNIAKAIDKEKIIKFLSDYKSKNNPKVLTDKNDLGYYLGGLLEGDGHISLPSVGSTTLNRVLNPRIVFTSHIDNLGMYSLIQSELGNIGRFQQTGKNVLRYIIGDMKGIIQILNLVHGKLRTPKNKRFNDLIKFINLKYSLDIPYSLLDKSNLQQNAWFSGFSEADAHFGIKYVESKPKSETRKRSVSESVSLKFRLDQRAFDKSTSIDMRPFMDTLALFLSCDIKTYKNNTNSEVLSLTVSAINDIKPIIDYFNKYPLLGNKLEDFKKWEIVFNMILVKEHLTEEGKLKIKSLLNKL